MGRERKKRMQLPDDPVGAFPDRHDGGLVLRCNFKGGAEDIVLEVSSSMRREKRKRHRRCNVHSQTYLLSSSFYGSSLCTCALYARQYFPRKSSEGDGKK